MSHFPDTSFLCSLYRTQVHSPQVDAYMEELEGPLRVSSLLLLEFRQSVRWHTRRHAKDKTKGFPKAEGAQMLRDLQSDLSAKVLIVVPVDWAEVHQKAEHLSARYTEANGHRLIDILHVATALHLSAEEFLTFDSAQKTLAKAEGLTLRW